MMRILAGLMLGWVMTCAVHAADEGAAPSATADPTQQILVLVQMPAEHFRADSSYSASYGEGMGRSARRRIAAQLARQHGLGLVSDWAIPLLGVDCFVMNVPPQQDLERAVAALTSDSQVAWAQAMNIYRAQDHDDPLYTVQPAATLWHLAALHEQATGRQVRIAVVDSGVESAHPDLAGQIELSENFVAASPFTAERHGTEVAGIIAARADNHVGIVGVAPHAHLLALRACWQASAHATLCTSLGLARALDFAIAHDAQVINLSLSGAPDLLLGKLLDVALKRGISVVAAMDRTLPGGGFPAAHPGVIAVADEGSGAVLAGTLLAPGRDIPTTGPPARWYFVSGSSYAAAHVSGLLALLLEVRAPRGASALARLPTGAVDAYASLMRALGPCSGPCAVSRTAEPATRQ